MCPFFTFLRKRVSAAFLWDTSSWIMSRTKTSMIRWSLSTAAITLSQAAVVDCWKRTPALSASSVWSAKCRIRSVGADASASGASASSAPLARDSRANLALTVFKTFVALAAVTDWRMNLTTTGIASGSCESSPARTIDRTASMSSGARHRLDSASRIGTVSSGSPPSSSFSRSHRTTVSAARSSMTSGRHSTKSRFISRGSTSTSSSSFSASSTGSTI
mmetsp:Transcript_8781/g.26466  ORF Transcript_8781/g.26466 Transcript_8781/m.26466 type:complete len:219 (+) Transcript_8781:5652-6308(+)